MEELIKKHTDKMRELERQSTKTDIMLAIIAVAREKDHDVFTIDELEEIISKV